MISARVVARPEESFDFVTQNYRELHTRLREAERIGEIHTTADYSYRYDDFSAASARAPRR